MDLVTAVLKNPTAQTIIAMLVLALFYERKAIIAMFRSRQDASEQTRLVETNRETKASDYARVMVERTLETMEQQQKAYQSLLEAEKIERRTKDGLILDQARAAEGLAVSAVEVMKDFAEIARANGDRHAAIVDTLIDVKQVLHGVGYVLATLYFQDNSKGFSDLIKVIEQDQEGGIDDPQ